MFAMHDDDAEPAKSLLGVSKREAIAEFGVLRLLCKPERDGVLFKGPQYGPNDGGFRRSRRVGSESHSVDGCGKV